MAVDPPDLMTKKRVDRRKEGERDADWGREAREPETHRK